MVRGNFSNFYNAPSFSNFDNLPRSLKFRILQFQFRSFVKKDNSLQQGIGSKQIKQEGFFPRGYEQRKNTITRKGYCSARGQNGTKPVNWRDRNKNQKDLAFRYSSEI